LSEAAKVLDGRRATLSDLINGNAALSAEMALRIGAGRVGAAKYFAEPPLLDRCGHKIWAEVERKRVGPDPEQGAGTA
jgi:hypothetical protein